MKTLTTKLTNLTLMMFKKQNDKMLDTTGKRQSLNIEHTLTLFTIWGSTSI